MSGRLRGALAAVALLVVATPRAARAVCNAGGGCPDVVATCCGSTSCTLDGTITVTDDVCVLNFGSRDVTITGEIAAATRMVTLVAGSVRLMGRLTASGGRGVITVTAPPGGVLGRPGMPAFSLTDRGRIDLSGSNGSTLAIDADGAVELRGGQGSLVSAKATDPGGAGGTIDITSRSDSITIGMPVSLDGGDSGIGGTLRLTAAKSLTFTPSAAPVSAAGGFEGGTLDFEGAESVAFNVGSNVQAIGAPLTGGSGGTIDVGGGTIDIEGILDASGGTGGVGGVGGDGGFVSIEARHGPLMVMRRSGGVGITVDGAPGGDSGEVDLSTDSPVSGTITVAAQLSAAAQGNTTITAGSGGTIGIDAAAKLALNANLDVSALTGDAGEIDLNENDNDIDVVVNAKLDVSAATGGGVLSIGNSHDVEFTPSASVNINAVGSLTGGGPGGEVTLSARRDVLFDAGAAGLSLDASGSGTFPGGSITAIAGRNLTVGRGASLHADGGGPSGALRLRAGRDATDSQWTGNVTVDGQVTATGNGAQPVALPCTDRDDRGCSIVLDGCQVTISVSGAVDSTDAGNATSNLLIGRKSITVAGVLRATGTGGANDAYASASPQTTGARAINPPLGPCAGGCVLPICTGRDPTSAAFMPDGCLVPCPTCGNGAVEFPEQCDDGNTNECDACDPHCRVPAHATCEDNNVCTSDDCDPTFGCRNEPLADGTGCDDGNLCTTADMCRGGA